jgi:hypothetical protein
MGSPSSEALHLTMIEIRGQSMFCIRLTHIWYAYCRKTSIQRVCLDSASRSCALCAIGMCHQRRLQAPSIRFHQERQIHHIPFRTAASDRDSVAGVFHCRAPWRKEVMTEMFACGTCARVVNRKANLFRVRNPNRGTSRTWRGSVDDWDVTVQSTVMAFENTINLRIQIAVDEWGQRNLSSSHHIEEMDLLGRFLRWL